MKKEQKIQENQYIFPYHYLSDIDRKNFSLSKHVFWGYEYISYIEFVISLIEKKNFKSLLDVGCGDGRMIYELNKRLCDKKIEGIDYSKRAIDFARAFNPLNKFYIGNINNIINKDYYDILTLIEVLEHIPEKEISCFIDSLSNKINNGGFLILTTPHDNLPKNKKHFLHFTRKKIQNLFEQKFNIKNIYFLNKKSFLVYVIEHFFSNRFFILNNVYLKNLLYKVYCANFLITDEKNCTRICTILEKK